MYSQHYTYVQVKVWSDLPSEIFVIHVADKWGLGCEDVWLDLTSALVTFREQKKYVCCNAMVIKLTVITLLTA